MKVFFAGAEGMPHAKLLLQTGAKNLLMTFYHLREKKQTIRYIQALKEEHGCDLFLDSGTFSFQAAANKHHQRLTLRDFEVYLADYIAFIREYGKYFYCIAELDVYRLVGIPKVIEWHKEYFREIDKTIAPVVYVWQPNLGKPFIKKMMTEWPVQYIAIGGYDSTPDTLRRVMCIEAIKKGIRTHGLALTRFQALRTMPFHSVDSSTWLGAARWGMSFVYKPGIGIIMLDKYMKSQRKLHKAFYEEAGANMALVMQDNTHEVLKGNILAILKEEADINSWLTKTGIGWERWNHNKDKGFL